MIPLKMHVDMDSLVFVPFECGDYKRMDLLTQYFQRSHHKRPLLQNKISCISTLHNQHKT